MEMTKFWRVAIQEYQRHVLRRRFLFALLSVPVMISIMVLMIIILVGMEMDNTPVGYVDQSGILENPLTPPSPGPPASPVPFISFENEAQARLALNAGELQAYYVLPADYLEQGQAKLVYIEEPRGSVYSQFNDFLSVNLLADYSPEVKTRISEGSDVVVKSIDNRREASQRDWFNIMLPLFAGIIFITAVFTSAGYLMQAVVEEKENRTMEILMTSVSPDQFMAGKILGAVSSGLTQIFVWGLFILLGLLIGRNYLEWLENVRVEWDLVGLMLLLMLPAFVLVSALMAAIGSTVTEAREGQQVAGLITLPVWIPYLMIVPIMESPNSPLAIALSLFPLTAPLTIVLRSGFTIIPPWQIALSLVLLILSALGALWLAGRTFRLGMLRYGKRLRWREIFKFG
jgi:ABC-2 type transport system permease protein